MKIASIRRRVRGRAARGGASLLLAAALASGCGSPQSADGPPRVRADDETLEGTYLDDERTVATFKGVRYAQPPIGDLRWRPPERLEPRKDVQAAAEFGPACPQPAVEVDHARELAADLESDPDVVPPLGATSEDCLYLNVWTSNLEGSELQPALVWVHGGSNVAGSGSRPPLDGEALARRGAVVVTLNYRLGLLGFLAHPALSAESPRRSSGNYGLLDQVAALEWVSRNIAAFGGDPERVTLAGHSTGGADVLYLMASPLAEGLFHRAISQSGSPMADTRTLVREEIRGSRLQELLGVEESDTELEELRAVTVERLLEVTPAQLNHERDSSPVTDGWVLRDLPGRVFGTGKQLDVPLLIGSNSDEWSNIGRHTSELTIAGFRGWLRSRWGPWADQAEELYPVQGESGVQSAVRRWQTDTWFTCPVGYAARSMARVSSTAYLYRFSRGLPGEIGERLGAFHGAEVAYAFDNLGAESWIPRAENDQDLAAAMADYWVAFARTGDPNVEGRPVWPRHERGELLELGTEIVSRTEPRSETCRLWDQRLESAIGLD